MTSNTNEELIIDINVNDFIDEEESKQSKKEPKEITFKEVRKIFTDSIINHELYGEISSYIIPEVEREILRNIDFSINASYAHQRVYRDSINRMIDYEDFESTAKNKMKDFLEISLEKGDRDFILESISTLLINAHKTIAFTPQTRNFPGAIQYLKKMEDILTTMDNFNNLIRPK